MPHVFISYAWQDGSHLARWLFERINALEGWSAWMDTKLHADTMFGYALQRQIDRADMVVVVLSPDVNREGTASFVQRELHYATQEDVGKPIFAACVPTAAKRPKCGLCHPDRPSPSASRPATTPPRALPRRAPSQKAHARRFARPKNSALNRSSYSLRPS